MKRVLPIGVGVGVVAALLAAPGAAVGWVGFDLAGAGRVTVDGVISPGEWTGAGVHTFAVNLPGGGTTTATLREQNDASMLYWSFQLATPDDLAGASFTIEFDNDNSGTGFATGDDAVVYTIFTEAFGQPEQRILSDDFRLFVDEPGNPMWWGPKDLEYGGTSDGSAAHQTVGGVTTVEVAHPLNSADDAHDFSLLPGMSVGAHLSVRLSTLASQNVDTDYPTDWTNPDGTGWGYGQFRILPYYQFLGFFQPVDPMPTRNKAQAGQAIPLKWRVLDPGGVPVADLTAVQVLVTSTACDGTAPTDAVEEYATGGSGLINKGDGYYQFNWKTLKSYAGSCRIVTVDVGDHVPYQAAFTFR